MNTIVAISTATGAGGIGIVRMSGKECFSILEKIFEPKRKDIKFHKNFLYRSTRNYIAGVFAW